MTRPTPRRAPALGLTLALLALGPAAAEELRTPPDRPVDVTHIDLDLRIDLRAREVAGTATIDVTAIRDTPVVTLDAVDHEVRAVRVALGDRPPAAAPFAYDGERLTVERPLARGESGAISVDYLVRDPDGGLHFFGPTEDAPDVPWQVWSQGEPETNRRWFPCVDHPVERQTTALTATVAGDLTVISNGRLVARREAEDGWTAWRYEQEREHVAYLVSVVVGRFDVVRDEWRGKPLAYYVPPGREGDIPRSFDRTKDMLDFFSDRFGVAYPWAKYDQVVVEQFGWGGMENTGATTLNERTLHDARAHLDYSSEGLVAHELGHQWFGDLITCRDWAHIWLNEGWATYSDALWVEHSRGPADYARDMLANADRGMRAGKERPILDRRYGHPWWMFDGRAYSKGSCVIHMLRRQLGEEPFWRGVRLYLERHMDSSAETHDLRRAFEDATGHSLERFFYDWVERPGNPVLDVRLDRDAARRLVTVRIRQTQDGEAYRFPAELVLRFGDREVRRTIDVASKDERLVLPEAEAPTWFRFDPREQVLLKEVKVHKGRGLWLTQLRQDDAFGRLRAARHLGRDGHRQATDALVTALAEDPFWGVRAEAARSLGKKQHDAAGEALRASAAAAEHPKVRRACVEALGRGGPDADAAEVLAAILQEGDASYYVEAAAVDAYARAAADPQGLLLAQLEKPSHNEVIRIAALDALRDLDDPALVSTLVPWVHPRHAPRVRQAAARALAAARLPGAAEEDRAAAVLALADLLAGGARRERRAALDALHDLASAARAALTVVEATAETDPEEGLRDRAGEVARRIRSGVEPDAELRRLRREIDRLRDAEGELRDRLEELEARRRADDGAE